MAKIKFNVVNETTIELAQDAKKGDIIDLSEVNELDLNALSSHLLTQIDKNAEAKATKIAARTREDIEKQYKVKIELERKKVEVESAKQLEKERMQITKLENEIANFKQQKELEVAKALQKSQAQTQQEKDKLQKEINDKLAEINLLQGKLTNQKENFELQKKMLEEENQRIKDFKEKQSTKMWGEDLEQYCSMRFEKDLRFAFPKAEFGKDNIVTESGKADFIFKDFTDNGNEYISIIFEMKNENPNSKNKQKNSEFYKKLEKNREDKKCEYAVLVSALEMDNPLFEEGVYKVPEYNSMYVIRPNFFTGIIKLLTTLKCNSRALVDEMEEKRRLNIDYTNFENNFNVWQKDVGINIERAKKKYDTAIEEIDKTIKHLTNVRDNLVLLNKNLTLMNEKAQDMTIKQLTRNAPKVQELIEEKKESK